MQYGRAYGERQNERSSSRRRLVSRAGSSGTPKNAWCTAASICGVAGTCSRTSASCTCAMQRADGGDYGALGELIARAMYDNLNRFIVPNVAGPARMVPLAALADEEFTMIALRRAAQRGRLDAVQGPDGIWRSSRKAVDAYRAARHQRRPGNTAPF